MKVKIINNGMNTRDCKVFIDGHDITENLTEIDVKIKGGEIPTLKLAFYPDDIEIEGDFEVLKKLPSEEHGTEIVINGNRVAKDLAKAMMENFNKSSYR
ncbi:hypothetical protein [Clostridium neonatale]|uniref:hypothetical protein n=1 Tax=Clostridium neonatale TaxID=137838 RepID=UPI00291B6F33|nr:hypothetical protein [Clostridium neonatale]CAI3552183.1 hypothetical protein CNEO3_1390003 [Clostridium neonatale]CAI3566814.1 hypothetical protein CNEO3_1420005 [Clostridium neonatale]CAI3581212.1 hypothetical protein CNEO3_1560005 [Clostridium neonatale]CAI3589898.1 hypothetical protein CNEO3_1640005 [Clostridium neonatale]CAI3607090.1 hypothetical protein CNEO3_260087 [Clostridium neonatale]